MPFKYVTPAEIDITKTSSFDAGVIAALIKEADKKDKPYAGFTGHQAAVLRASRKNPKDWTIDPALHGEMTQQGAVRSLVGGAGGALGGAGLGALAAKFLSKGSVGAGTGARAGAIFGALAGLIGGDLSGQYAAQKKYLKPKGVTMSRGGFKIDMTPEARKKYLHKKYQGGGVK